MRRRTDQVVRLLAVTAAAAIAAALPPATAYGYLLGGPTPSAATAAFGRWLHARYGPVTGFWKCPPEPAPIGRLDCLAEVRAGRTWHQTTVSATIRNGRIAFSHAHEYTWVRHWWPYSRYFILRSREPQVSGVMAVNSPAYDWGLLATEIVGLRPGHTVRANAYDGYAAGWLTVELFTCSAASELTTCTNELGDTMRYRPRQ